MTRNFEKLICEALDAAQENMRDWEGLRNIVSDPSRRELLDEILRGLGYEQHHSSLGLSLIAAERHRQVHKEGFTEAHDDNHDTGAIAQAAACYALSSCGNRIVAERHWPFESLWWKPSKDNPIADLKKAGALIIAEIDRLHRAGKKKKTRKFDEEEIRANSTDDRHHTATAERVSELAARGGEARALHAESRR